MPNATVLIIDDEALVCRVLSEALRRSGYHVEFAISGASGLKRLAQHGIDLLLLDLHLGDIDGVQVMQTTRQMLPYLPIIMLTAHGSLPSAIAAMRCGAADYLLKPISVEALRESVTQALATASAANARSQQLQAMCNQMQVFLQSEGFRPQVTTDSLVPQFPQRLPGAVAQAGPLRVDVQRHAVSMAGQMIDVTPSEFVILQELLNQSGAVVTCKQLMQALNTPVNDEDEARQLIRPHIARLRRKLEPDAQQPRYLLSIRGVGYRWASEYH